MKKRNIIEAIIYTVAFIIYTVLVKFVDVKPIGPNESKVGFAAMNKWFMKLVGENKFFYKISEVLGIIILLLVLIYGCIGLYQLIKRKNLLKIDREIIVLGCFYVAVLVMYVVFDKAIVINYRPVLEDGVLEPSYPSSHTMLALCVGLSSLIVSKSYFNKKYIDKINIVTCVLIGLIVAGRLLSGVHWLSDIFGGVLLSCALIAIFKVFYDVEKVGKKK